MPSDPVTSRRSFLHSVALVGAGVSIAGLVDPFVATEAHAATFTHPGLLHTSADFTDLTARAGETADPWASGWDAVRADARSQTGWSASPVAELNVGGSDENFTRLLDDAHAAYQNALLWKLTGDAAHADTARDILNAWSQALTSVSGTPLLGQTAGIHGFVLANAAEIVRDHEGFDTAGFAAMLTDVLHPVSDAYLTATPDTCGEAYGTNWKLSHIASALAIGIFCDDTAKMDQATALITDTPRIMNSVPYVWDGGASDRYSVTGLSLLAAVCEMAWSQGVDLYASHDNRLLAASEEIARYEPASSEVPLLGTWGTSATSPAWVIIHHHYVTRKGLSAPNTANLADRARAEGGGFDRLGLGGLAYSL
ncbi:alginate lyase family protein [Nocardiopsis sp. EMB25]|uniref:alginate lyase family protein n=1 Tax=Nocardiopsis TaxID=2013 RepID=UPI00034CF518|nr:MULTISPECIES: alginate lyase family protein [Nocardiopsis]MCY9785635.1 alginate lyase family protein [Nocardiopsis sp. EMB25]